MESKERPYLRILIWTRQKHIVLKTLAIIILILLFGWNIKSFSLLGIGIEKEEPPLFKYIYTEDIFEATSDQNIDITQVDWIFLSRYWSPNQEWDLKNINYHPTIISNQEIIDYLAEELNYVNPLPQNEAENLIRCGLYLFVDMGIPALVSVTYDTPSKQNLTQKDLIKIMRLDTPIPKMVVQQRNVDENNISAFFKENTNMFESILKTIKNSTSDGTTICGVMINQPSEGYKVF